MYTLYIHTQYKYTQALHTVEEYTLYIVSILYMFIVYSSTACGLVSPQPATAKASVGFQLSNRDHVRSTAFNTGKHGKNPIVYIV